MGCGLPPLILCGEISSCSSSEEKWSSGYCAKNEFDERGGVEGCDLLGIKGSREGCDSVFTGGGSSGTCFIDMLRVCLDGAEGNCKFTNEEPLDLPCGLVPGNAMFKSEPEKFKLRMRSFSVAFMTLEVEFTPDMLDEKSL
ncbi:MAG: hypothetical protein LBB29_02115 [Holosporaceae bacterium]|jgi:hypothetical protein|nr:hypothetical protein [Holosporaceae bacterium]